MNASLFLHRTWSLLPLWPRLRRTHNRAQTLLQTCTPQRAQRRFVPMAILLDETQAYKPANHADHQALPN